PRDEQVPSIAISKNHSRPESRRYHEDPVASLLIGHGKRLPRFSSRLLRRLNEGTPLRRVRLVGYAAARWPFGAALGGPAAPAPSAKDVTEVKDRAVKAIDSLLFSISVCDRARRIDQARPHNRAHNPQLLRTGDGNAGGQSKCDCEIGGVHRGHQQT